jgi:hypothetical protein
LEVPLPSDKPVHKGSITALLRHRLEMTDAAVGQRAECVMLNKGRHILEAVKILATILTSEDKHYAKKRQLFREFTKQSEFIS